MPWERQGTTRDDSRNHASCRLRCPVKLPSMNLLLAEDDAILADALTEQLRHAGFETEHAPNGAVAEFLLLKQPWDLCILDLGLPMVDGLTVLQRVRQKKPELPVLVLTALDD